MHRARRAVAATVVLVLALALGACPGGSTKRASTIPMGGTLRVALKLDQTVLAATDEFAGEAFDPQLTYDFAGWQVLHCCLARTLLTHASRPTEQGGARLVPDLASGMPAVSADGLTWTFRLRGDVRYSPPFAAVRVRAADFVRAFQREARVGGDRYSFYYSVVEGFDAYASGKATTITGLETPDDRTLVVRLTEASGDFGYRLTLPGIAPIPPSPVDPAAPFGVASAVEERSDGLRYGLFAVSTGPYMLAGSEAVDFTLPRSAIKPASGFTKGKSFTLVRNPSWRRSTDPIRGAYVDRIEGVMLPNSPDTALQIGEAFDVILRGRPAGMEELAAYRKAERDLGARIEVGQRDFVRSIVLNPATPPFDDVHVRRAANYAVDKDRVVAIFGGGLAGKKAGHIGIDSLLDDLLVDYAPYDGPAAERLTKARAEMSRSRYDANKDGRCDPQACRGIAAPFLGTRPEAAIAARSIREDLLAIGLDISLAARDSGAFFDSLADQSTHTPMGLFFGWGKDFMNASNFFEPLFKGAQIGNSNFSPVGATPAQLRGWGYSVTSVPSVDDRIDSCLKQTGREQTSCWASLDQYLMQEVVPWIPLTFENIPEIISSRVVRYSFDQFSNQVALDQIALRPGAESRSPTNT